MYELFLGMRTDIEMLKSAFGRSLRVGAVHEVDAQKGYRLKLGEGADGPFLSPWYPHPESGGQTESWMPLSVGQIVGVINPGGDPRQGVLLRGGFGGNGPPSTDLAANVLKAFGVEISIKDGKVTLKGDLLVQGNVDFEGGHVRHNGTETGDTHKHGGITPGGAITDVPVG